MRIRVTTRAHLFEERKRQHIERGYRIEDERPIPVNGLCSFIAVRELPVQDTLSALVAEAVISRPEVQKWIDRGWLQCRAVQVQSVTRKIIDAEDFCLFVKNHGRAVIGNRLSYEGLAFVRDYVFPRPHADLLSVRGPYGRGKKPAQANEPAPR
jgi:hypothetical protein